MFLSSYFSTFLYICQFFLPWLVFYHACCMEPTSYLVIHYNVLPSLKYPSMAWCLSIKQYSNAWILLYGLLQCLWTKCLILESSSYFAILSVYTHIHKYIDVCYILHTSYNVYKICMQSLITIVKDTINYLTYIYFSFLPC